MLFLMTSNPHFHEVLAERPITDKQEKEFLLCNLMYKPIELNFQINARTVNFRNRK